MRITANCADVRSDTEDASAVLERIGKDILGLCRDELYFSMRFMDVALSSFHYIMDPEVHPFGTDGYGMYFNPRELGGLFRDNRILANRGYLHMVLHCIFRHPLCGITDERYRNLSCDIAAEHIIDGCDLRPVRYSRSLLRRETYRKLEKSGHVLNAERICALLLEWNLTEKELSMLEQEFYMDDHSCWTDSRRKRPPESQLEKKWREIDEKMETDLETFSKEASEKSGSFLDELRVRNREKRSYAAFLRKFSVFREEMKADQDTFDYGFYTYGLSLYGNMPLIEPLETREVRKIQEFAVIVDTSMSCSGELVRRFLDETYNVLAENNSYFQKVNVHVIQCDEDVREDVKISSVEELAEYMESFRLYGGGGTDFRPAFEYVDEMIQKGEFTNLKGLIYFTDGYGVYPERMPSYKTAFVFMKEDYRDADVPPWAICLVIDEESLMPLNKR